MIDFFLFVLGVKFNKKLLKYWTCEITSFKKWIDALV